MAYRNFCSVLTEISVRHTTEISVRHTTEISVKLTSKAEDTSSKMIFSECFKKVKQAPYLHYWIKNTTHQLVGYFDHFSTNKIQLTNGNEEDSKTSMIFSFVLN